MFSDLYAGIIESVDGIRLPLEHLRLLRAMQLLREDFEDADENVKNDSERCVALRKKGMLEKAILKIIQVTEEKLRDADAKIRDRFEREKCRLSEFT